MREEKERNLHQHTSVAILAWICVCGGALAQNTGAESLNVDMAQCINLSTEADRLACYQKRVEAALEQQRTATAGTQTRSRTNSSAANPAPAPAPTAAQTSSGAAPAVAASADSLGPGAISGQSDEPAAEQISGTITNLRETMPNRWVVTLDNGQVWQMNQSKYYPLRVGLNVVLYPTRWGASYRLTAPEHRGFVQVRRAR